MPKSKTRPKYHSARAVDSFGTAQFGGNGPPIRARIIQTDETEYAFFPESSDIAPLTLRFTEPPRIRGRVLSGTLLTEGPADFAFARASCGCQTPRHLRGPARNFLAQLPPEPELGIATHGDIDPRIEGVDWDEPDPAMWTADGKPIPFPDGAVPV